MEKFSTIYPFTTEMISGYIEYMDVSCKSVLTVGSSFDQAFNALLYGAKDVTVIDINKKALEFYKRKLEVLLTSNKDEFYKNVLQLPFNYNVDELFVKRDVSIMNSYMQSEDNFSKLKEILSSKTIKFINDDIFRFDKVENKYDRIIFSNVLQSIKAFLTINTKDEFIKCFNMWKEYLNEDGLLQLLYIYSYNSGSFSHEEAFNLALTCLDEMFYIHKFDNNKKTDAIVVYEKK